jgi:hypothetical protein
MSVFVYTVDVTFGILLLLSSTSGVVLNNCASDLDSQFSEEDTNAFRVHAVLLIIWCVDLKHYTVYLSHRSVEKLKQQVFLGDCHLNSSVSELK